MIRSLARRCFLTANTLRYRIEFRIVAELVSQIPGGKLGSKVLDAGAGTGEMSLRLMRAGLCDALIGVEPMEANFRLLRQNYAGKAHCAVHQADLASIPVASGSVDAVISTQVFEHIEDDQAAAAEVARVIRSGGYALISTPHPPEVFPNDGHVRPGYTVEEMAALFAPVGLQLLDHRLFFTLPTLQRLMRALHLGAIGRLAPIGWADCEKGLSQAEIAAQQPYGIACLFQKI